MLDFTVTTTPTRFPQACVACTGNVVPFVETHREVPGLGQVYVCAECVRRSAIALGLLRDDELANAMRENEELTTLLGQMTQRQSELENLAGLAERVSAVEERLAPTTTAAR